MLVAIKFSRLHVFINGRGHWTHSVEDSCQNGSFDCDADKISGFGKNPEKKSTKSQPGLCFAQLM